MELLEQKIKTVFCIQEANKIGMNKAEYRTKHCHK